jgi:hypothetical protein
VILGDPHPPDYSAQDDIAGYGMTYDRYMSLCDADATCAALGDLRRIVRELYDRLEAERPIFTTANPFGGPPLNVRFDGDTAAWAIIHALSFGAPGAIAPVLAARGEDSGAIAAAYIALNQDLNPAQPTAWGRYISQYCEDEDRFVGRDGVRISALANPLFAGFSRDAYLEVCARWPTRERSAVIAALWPADPPPALIVSGGLNAFSLPEYATDSAPAFKDARVVVFPQENAYALLHIPCARELRLQFLRDPSADLDTQTCIDSAPKIEFVAGTDGG